MPSALRRPRTPFIAENHSNSSIFKRDSTTYSTNIQYDRSEEFAEEWSSRRSFRFPMLGPKTLQAIPGLSHYYIRNYIHTNYFWVSQHGNIDG